MNKFLGIFCLVLFASTAGAAGTVVCIRGGSMTRNLPFDSYYLHLRFENQNNIEFKIFEKTYEGTRGKLVMSDVADFSHQETDKLRRFFSTSDAGVQVAINMNRRDEIISAHVSGRGRGVSRALPFSFEARSCQPLRQ